MKHFLFLFSLVVFMVYILTDCANITPPMGGPKDTLAPILLNSVPPNKSLNYSGKIINLEYNEYLKIENLNKQLIITPVIDQEYETKLRRNSIELLFPEPFEDSTTYTFNFRKAIQDITEGNVTGDNVFAFSTGPYIDSLTISGTVTHLLNKKPLEDYTVSLYSMPDTLDIFNSRPMYLTFSDKDGNFLIENIKTGVYRIYAYRDKNSNLICDNPNEPFGFIKDTIHLNQNIDSVNIKVYNVDLRPIKIQRSGPAGQYYEIRLNKDILNYKIEPADTTYTVYHNMPSDRRTIRFYNTFDLRDSLEFYFSATDSIHNNIKDTLYLKFTESRREKEKFTFSLTPGNDENITDKFAASVRFNKPVKNILSDSIYFKYDSLTYQYLDDSLFSFNNARDKISFSVNLFYTEYLKELQERDTAVTRQKIEESSSPADRSQLSGRSASKKLTLHIGTGSFISVEKDSAEFRNFNYSRLKEENYGIISGNVISEYPLFFIQLLNQKSEVIEEIKDKNSYSFRNIKPGEYNIRVLVDENNNGRWDPGNILKNEAPEYIYILPETISLRANWELNDIDLEF